LKHTHEIESGFTQALRYLTLGFTSAIRARNGFPLCRRAKKTYFPLCPDAKLLLGIDLRWWSAESGSVDQPSDPQCRPDKVLMGPICAGHGLGHSIRRFFKLDRWKWAVRLPRRGILAQSWGREGLSHVSIAPAEPSCDAECHQSRLAGVRSTNYFQRDPGEVDLSWRPWSIKWSSNSISFGPAEEDEVTSRHVHVEPPGPGGNRKGME